MKKALLFLLMLSMVMAQPVILGEAFIIIFAVYSAILSAIFFTASSLCCTSGILLFILGYTIYSWESDHKALWRAAGLILIGLGLLPILGAILLFLLYLNISYLDVGLSLAMWIVLCCLAYALLFLVKSFLLRFRKEDHLTRPVVRILLNLGRVPLVAIILSIFIYLVGSDKITILLYDVFLATSQILSWLIIDLGGQQCVTLQLLFGFLVAIHLIFSVLSLILGVVAFKKDAQNFKSVSILLFCLGGLLFFGALLWLTICLFAPIFLNNPGVTSC